MQETHLFSLHNRAASELAGEFGLGSLRRDCRSEHALRNSSSASAATKAGEEKSSRERATEGRTLHLN